MDWDRLKLSLFGSTTRPEFSEANWFKVLFWPDGYLIASFLLSVMLVIVVVLSARRADGNDAEPTPIPAPLVHIGRLICFVALVGALSGTVRLAAFILGGSAQSSPDQAAVTAFSLLFLVPTLFCASLASVCGWALYSLLRLRLRT